MRYIFKYSRKVVIDTTDQYRPVTYEHGLEIEYNDEDIKEQTIMIGNEFKELRDEIDNAQRRCIEKETGVDTLPMDKMKNSISKRTILKRK